MCQIQKGNIFLASSILFWSWSAKYDLSQQVKFLLETIRGYSSWMRCPSKFGFLSDGWEALKCILLPLHYLQYIQQRADEHLWLKYNVFKSKIVMILWWFTELLLAVHEYGNWNRNIYTLVIIAILLKLRWNKIIKFPKRKIYCDNKDSHENQTEIIEIMFFLNRS